MESAQKEPWRLGEGHPIPDVLTRSPPAATEPTVFVSGRKSDGLIFSTPILTALTRSEIGGGSLAFGAMRCEVTRNIELRLARAGEPGLAGRHVPIAPVPTTT